MKVLLDEQVDFRMKPMLHNVEAYTLHDFGWLGLKNGELREQLHANGFQALVTADKNMPFQQNLSRVTFSLLLLDTPSLLWENQVLFIPKLLGFLTSPPVILPRIVHFSVEGLSLGNKKLALSNLVGADDILFL
jgi:hypothetical protein